MKKNLRKAFAGLMVGIMAMSTVSQAMAADIVYVQNSEINVDQGEKNKNKKEHKVAENTIETSKEIADSEKEAKERETISDESLEEKNEPETETIEYIETCDKDVSEESFEENKKTEEKNDSKTSVEVNNTNYIEINNNTGNVIVNIYNGINVDVDNTEDEANINISNINDVEVYGDDEIPTETVTEEITEETTIAVQEETTTEETTEKRTESEKGSRRSGGGSSSKAAMKKTEDTAETSKKVSAQDEQKTTEKPSAETSVKNIEKEKRVVCMTIGSNNMNVNGNIVETDASPYISDGCTMVPLRCLSTVFDDADVLWNNETKTVTVTSEKTTAVFEINADYMYVNGKYVSIPKAAEIQNGRTYVPLRTLGEAIGANVSWIPDSKSVLVIK